MLPNLEEIYHTPTMLRIAKRIHSLSNEELKTLNTYISDVQECLITEIARRHHRATPKSSSGIRTVAPPDERPTIKNVAESLQSRRA